MEDDIQNYLSTVMFRGTPCTSQFHWSQYTIYKIEGNFLECKKNNILKFK